MGIRRAEASSSTTSRPPTGRRLMATALIVPPPLPLPTPDERRRSRCRLGGAVPGVSRSLPVCALFGLSLNGGALLAALRLLAVLRCIVHAGKTPTHERLSPT